MALLKPDRNELFAQGLAGGIPIGQAYADAGYSPNPSAATRLAKKVKIINRVAELQSRKAAKVVLTKHYVVEAAIENLEKALGRKPVKVGHGDGIKEVYVYKGDVANQAVKMLGAEFNLFTERKDVRITNEYSNLTDAELAQRLVEVGQQMLLGGPVVEHDPDETKD